MKISKRNYAVYLYIFLLALIKGLSLDISSYLSVALFGTLFILSFVNDGEFKYSLYETLIFMALFIVGALDFVVGNTTSFLFLAMTLFLQKNINIVREIKIIFFTLLSCFIFMLVTHSIEIFANTQSTIYREGEGFVIRYSFGYSHPNYMHFLYFSLLMMFAYLYSKRYNIFVVVIALICNYILYRFTCSRSGYYLCIIGVVAYYLVIKFSWCRRVILKIGRPIILLLLPLTILLGTLYGHVDFLFSLDTAMTGRVQYISRLIKLYVPPIIGSQKYNQSVNFDNGYMSLLYENGILATILFYMILVKALKKFKSTGDYNLMFIYVIVSLYGMTESFYPSVTANFFLLFLSYGIYGKLQSRDLITQAGGRDGKVFDNRPVLQC